MTHLEFVKLVKQMRGAEKNYWLCGREQEDLKSSLALEKRVDDEIKRVSDFLRTHPEAKPPEEVSEAWKFFCLVVLLRDKTRKYFIEKKRVRRLDAVKQEVCRVELQKLLDEVKGLELRTDRTIQRIEDNVARQQGKVVIYQVVRSYPRLRREPNVVLTTRDEKYAAIECSAMNDKQRDGSVFAVKRIEKG